MQRTVKAGAGAATSEVSGRLRNAPKRRMRARAGKHKANKAMIALVASSPGLSCAGIVIERGLTRFLKRILIDGVDHPAFCQRLDLDEPE